MDVAEALPCTPRGNRYLLAAPEQPPWEELPQKSPEVVPTLQQRMEAARQVASNLCFAGQAMTLWYQPCARDVQNALGDRVCLYNPCKKRGLAPRLQSNWERPCTVLELLSDIICKLDDGTRKGGVTLALFRRLMRFPSTFHSSA